MAAARVALCCTCVSGLVSCSDVDTAQVTAECDTTNSTARAVSECAVAIPAVRDTNEPRMQDRILANVVDPPAKAR